MFAKVIDFSEISKAQVENNKQYFWTTFTHLSAHFGFRRGMLSGYIGSTGSGKSSLFKTLAVQAANTGPDTKVLMWLSEESKGKYARAMKQYSDMSGGGLEKVEFYEESEMDPRLCETHEDFLDYFKTIVTSGFYDIVFLDNISTSKLYSSSIGFKNQGKTVEFLKNMAKDLNIAIVYLAHTSSNVTDNMNRLITTEDIRGSKDIVIQTSYFYVLQKFTANGKIYLSLRTLKFRDHTHAGGTYILNYDPALEVYIGDTKVEFEMLNKIFKERDYLGRKS